MARVTCAPLKSMSGPGGKSVDGASATTPSWSSRRSVVGAAWSDLLRSTFGAVRRNTEPLLPWPRDESHVSARGGEMPSGREDMDLCTDKVLSKGRILQELTKAVKLVSDARRSSTFDLSAQTCLAMRRRL